MRSDCHEREASSILDLQPVCTTELLEATFRHSTCWFCDVMGHVRPCGCVQLSLVALPIRHCPISSHSARLCLFQHPECAVWCLVAPFAVRALSRHILPKPKYTAVLQSSLYVRNGLVRENVQPVRMAVSLYRLVFMSYSNPGRGTSFTDRLLIPSKQLLARSLPLQASPLKYSYCKSK
jgi:hypothetical protein